ncbi:MAG: alpha/beta hydrolase [Caulobacteraceae bacterium]
MTARPEAFVRLHGRDQKLTFGAVRPGLAPLLVVSGPGVALSSMADYFAAWEDHFTVIHWDQPWGAPGDAPLTLDRLAADGIAVIEAALAHTGAAKLNVLGISGGSVVGLKIAKSRPDLLSGYVGTGQFVNWSAQIAAGYTACLPGAEELKAIGPPPWTDLADMEVFSRIAGALTHSELQALSRFRPAPADHDPRARGMAAFSALWPELAAFDARTLGPDYATPMFFLQGAKDRYSNTAEVATFVASTTAPRLVVDILPEAGHSAFFLTEPMLERMRLYLT